jgi:hypothetical protein
MLQADRHFAKLQAESTPPTSPVQRSFSEQWYPCQRSQQQGDPLAPHWLQRRWYTKGSLLVQPKPASQTGSAISGTSDGQHSWLSIPHSSQVVLSVCNAFIYALLQSGTCNSAPWCRSTTLKFVWAKGNGAFHQGHRGSFTAIAGA